MKHINQLTAYAVAVILGLALILTFSDAPLWQKALLYFVFAVFMGCMTFTEYKK